MSPNDSEIKNQPSDGIEEKQIPASLLRLLGAWLYDFLLLCAVWLLAGILYIIPAQLFVQIDSNAPENLTTTEFTSPIYYGYLFFITWFFFAWFWTHGGQTLGLRSWSLRLQTIDGYSVTWLMTIIRFMVAGAPWVIALFLYDQLTHVFAVDSSYRFFVFIIGFSGLLPILIDKQKRSLQDIVSKTQIIRIQKQ